MSQKPKKVGVFLSRFQPLHKAHLYVIETALKECDEVAIMIGSSNKSKMPRNPFDLHLRKSMLMDAIKDNKNFDKLGIYELPDWSQEDSTEDNYIWGNYLYYNIVSRICQKNFTIYYSDEPEMIQSWFNETLSENVEFRFLERKKVLDGLSSSKIRDALFNFTEEDQEYLKKYLPDSVYSRINELRGIYVDILNNPLNDFTMK